VLKRFQQQKRSNVVLNVRSLVARRVTKNRITRGFVLPMNLRLPNSKNFIDHKKGRLWRPFL
jgi:hypothetical protein